MSLISPTFLSDHIPVRALREALAGLPQLTRDVFIAHCIDDLDYGVIAARLGISVTDVQREFARAMAVLDAAGTDGG